VDLDQLIDSYTINPAKQLLLENDIGSITVGKSADLVVWDTNWFQAANRFAKSQDVSDLDPIANSSVVYTIFLGQIVFDAQK
jgi:predicted amidohydrolase YtcJ